MKQKCIIYTLLVLFSWGCGDDFMKPDPKSFYTPENSLVNKKGMEASLAACGSIVRNEFYEHAAMIMAEYIFSDIAIMGGDDDNIPINLDVMILPDAKDGLDKDTKIRPYWEAWWNMIKYANVIIGQIDNAKFDTEADRNSIIGEAYFYRAYAYYRLTHQFGDVPLILEEIKSPRLDFESFSRESILRKMRDDMKDAVQWLPNNAPYGKVNKASGNHLLTKIYLSLGEFDDAIRSASNVIDDGMHALMKDRFGTHQSIDIQTDGFQAYANGGAVKLDVIYDLHSPENKSIPDNKEVLFSVIDRFGLEGSKGEIATMRNCTPYWNRVGIIKTPSGAGGMMRDFDDLGEYHTIGRGQGFLRMANSLCYEMWDEKDMRHKQPNWWRMEDMVYNNQALKGTKDEIYYGTHIVKQDVGLDSIRCWSPFFNKFIIPDDRIQPNGFHSDWYVYRLAETYLLRAEAYFWKGELALAANDLNEVHTRAGCDPVATLDITIDMILDERAKELYYEEPRKCELTRISYLFAKTGKPYNGKSYSIENFSQSNFFYDRVITKNNYYREHVLNKNGSRYKISAWHVLWPIPADAINANTMGHINQNKGYSGSETNKPLKNYPEDYM